MAAQRKEMDRYFSTEAKNTKNYLPGSEATASGHQVTVDTDTDLNTCSSTNDTHMYVDLLNFLPSSQFFDGSFVCPKGPIFSPSTEDDTDRFILANRLRQKSATGEPENASSSSRFQSPSRDNLRVGLLSDEIISSCSSSVTVLSKPLGPNQLRYEIDASCKDSGQLTETTVAAVYDLIERESSDRSINTGSEPTSANAMWKFKCEPDQPVVQFVKHSTTTSENGIWKFKTETNNMIAVLSKNESRIPKAIDQSTTLVDKTAESSLLKSTIDTDDSALILYDKRWSPRPLSAGNSPIDTAKDDDGTKASKSQILVEVGTAVQKTIDSDMDNLFSQDRISIPNSRAVLQNFIVACRSEQCHAQEITLLSSLLRNAETIAAPNSLEPVDTQIGAVIPLPLASSFVTLKESSRLDLLESSSASNIVWGVSEEASQFLNSKRSSSVQDDSQSVYATVSPMKRGSDSKSMCTDQKAAVNKIRSQTIGSPLSLNRRDVAKLFFHPSHRDSIHALSHNPIWRKQQPSSILSDFNRGKSPPFCRDNEPAPEATKSSNPSRFGQKTSSEALNQKYSSGSSEKDSNYKLTLPDIRKSRKDEKSSSSKIAEYPENSQLSKKSEGCDTAKKNLKSTAHVVRRDSNSHKKRSSRSKKHSDLDGAAKERLHSREKKSKVSESAQRENSKPAELTEVDEDETSYCRDFTSGSTNAELITLKRSKRTSKSLPRELDSNALKPPSTIPQNVALNSFNNRKPIGRSIKTQHDVIEPIVRKRSSSRKKSTDSSVRNVTPYSKSQDLPQTKTFMWQHSEKEQTGVMLTTLGSTSDPICVSSSDSQRLAVDNGFTLSRQMLKALQTNSLQVRLNLRLQGASDATSKTKDQSTAGQWGDLTLALPDSE